MMDTEFNDNQRSQKVTRRARPYGKSNWAWTADKESYKSRWQVSSKLTEVNWHSLNNWCKKHDLSLNRGINKLIATHPELQNDA